MNISEILKAKGIEDATIQGILDDMKSNKIFTAGEENLDVRYGKLKTDHEGKLAELTEAQNLIAELKKSNKGNESLQSKITDYEAQVAQLQAELEQTKLESAIKVELLASKALSTKASVLSTAQFVWRTNFLALTLAPCRSCHCLDLQRAVSWSVVRLVCLKAQERKRLCLWSATQLGCRRLPKTWTNCKAVRQGVKAI